MGMEAWLAEALLVSSRSLTEEAEGYLLGRGVSEASIQQLEVGLWEPPEEVSPIPSFTERYGPKGHKLRDMLVYPLRSPKGTLLGFEGRSMRQKYVTQFKLPRAMWNPIFVGLPYEMEKIWEGQDIWIGEGIFDKTALEHIVPPEDATLGTLTAKLSFEQFDFLRRFARGTVNLVWDQDEKGRKATEGYTHEKTGKWVRGAIERLRSVKVKCRDIPYLCPPGCKDPGDIWEQYGTGGLRRAFSTVII